MKNKLKSLNKWNKGLAALHAIQAVLILVIASDFSLPVTVNYLTFDTATETLSAATNELFRIEIALLVFTFLALSAIFHVSIATWYRKTYEKNLKKNINRARWYEYSLSASTMMVAIAMLSGIYDLTVLISFFVLTAVMNLAGLIMESTNDFKSKAINWFSYNVGSLAGIVPWIGVGVTLWASGYYATGDSAVPTFVYIIFFSIFLAFSIFALNMYLQYKKIGPWKDYLYGERMYMILSLVAKSLLAWQVFAGTLQPA